jgi:hypothetical protein
MTVPRPIDVESWPRSTLCRCEAAAGTLCEECRAELAEDHALHNDTPPGRCGGGDLPDDPLLYFEQRREEILAFYRVKDEDELRRSRAAAPKVRKVTHGSVPVLLSRRDRDLIVDHTFADPEYIERLQPIKDGRLRGKYTLDDLDDLMGFVAAEANHCKSNKLEKELDDLWGRLQAVMEAYDDGEAD